MNSEDPERRSWMSAPSFGRSLRPGIGISLQVSDVSKAVRFAVDVLGATCTYSDTDFAALKLLGSDFIFHSDRAYRNNPASVLVRGAIGRGGGAELRIYGCDPDMAEERARAGGWTVLAGAMDKSHGLRECIILDDDGYCWVPGVALPPDA